MKGQLPPDQNTLFFDFSLERHIPKDHLLRLIISSSILIKSTGIFNPFIVTLAGPR